MFQHSDRSSLEAAAEAAAKVNELLIAKGMLKPSQLPGVPNLITKLKTGGPDSLVVAEVDINNLTPTCRNTLTKVQTQEEISKASGASVTTRGRYMLPEEKAKSPRDRSLYLNVQASTKDSVDIAVQKVNEIIRNMNGNKHNEQLKGRGNHRGGRGMKQHFNKQQGSFRGGGGMRNPPPRPLMSLPTPVNETMQMPILEQPPPQTMTIVQEKLYVGLEHAPPNFDTKNKLLGPEGSYLQHIQLETGASVTLRGKASGFVDMAPGENFEPMHVHIEHQSLQGLQEARKLAENLIQTVQQSYVSFQQALAALPETMATGHITGVRQQPQFIEQHIMPPPMAAVAERQLQPLQPQVHQLGPPPIMLPPNSVANQVHQLQVQSGPQHIVLPSSLAPSQMTQVVNSLPVSAPSMLIHQPVGSVEQTGGQPQLILSHQPAQQGGPPPPLHLVQQTAPQAALGPPSLGVPPPVGPPQLYQNPVPSAGVYSSVQPQLQLVSQPVMSVVQPGQQPQPSLTATQLGQPPPQHHQTLLLGPPPPSQTPQPQAYSASSSVVYTVASSSGIPYYSSPKMEPMTKRRFTEEKDDGMPDNVLGYQHGPPHLVNLVRSSPPPMSQVVTGQAPQQHVILQGPPPQVTHMIHPGAPPPQGAPPQFQPIDQPPPQVQPPFSHAQGQQLLTGPPPPHNQGFIGPPPGHSTLPHQFEMGLQTLPAPSSNALMPPPPPPSLSSSAGWKEEENMTITSSSQPPEVPWETQKRSSTPSPSEPDRKKIRGILKNKNNSANEDGDKEPSDAVGSELDLQRQHDGTEGVENELEGHQQMVQQVNHPASPQYQGQPLRYPNHASDPNLPPTSMHEQLTGQHPHMLPQPPELGHLIPHPHIHLEGHPRPDGPPRQIVLEAPPPGLQITPQATHPHHQILASHLAGPRPLLLEQHPEQATHLAPPLGAPQHGSHELLEIEMQQQQLQAPPPQFHHLDPHIIGSQPSHEQQILSAGSAAVMVSSNQHFASQYSSAVSSTPGLVPPPPPPPSQSYTLATSAGGLPLALHNQAAPPPPPQQILTAGPPNSAISSYSLVHGQPSASISYSISSMPPPLPTSSPQYHLQTAPPPGHLFQSSQIPVSQYQPTQQAQQALSYWLSPPQ